MAKRRTASRKKKKNLSPFVVFLIVIVVLALLSAGISYFMLNDGERSTVGVKTENAPSEELLPGKTVTTPEQLPQETGGSLLDGTWVSNYDGTMMTVKGQTCVFEKPSVDSPVKVEAVILINKTLVSFIFSEKSTCGSAEGHYEFQLTGESEVFFKRIKDQCKSRSEQMSASWFKL